VQNLGQCDVVALAYGELSGRRVSVTKNGHRAFEKQMLDFYVRNFNIGIRNLAIALATLHLAVLASTTPVRSQSVAPSLVVTAATASKLLEVMKVGQTAKDVTFEPLKGEAKIKLSELTKMGLSCWSCSGAFRVTNACSARGKSLICAATLRSLHSLARKQYLSIPGQGQPKA
jgi:hypothetical protein